MEGEDIIDKLKDMGRRVLAPTKRKRRKALKRVANWIVSANQEFDELHMDQIWKVLWYCMYMCDKLQNQQDLAEEMAAIIHSLDEHKAHLFFWRYYQTMAREWHGIDKWRTDKFYYLSHQILLQGFNYLKNKGWDIKLIDKFFNSMIQEGSILNSGFTKCPSVKMDIVQYFLKMLTTSIEEEKNVPSKEVMFRLLNPIFHLLLKETNINTRKRMNEHFFNVVHKNWENKFEQDKKDKKKQQKEKTEEDQEEEEEENQEEEKSFELLIDLHELTLLFSRFCLDEETTEGNRKYLFNLRNKFNILLEKFSGSKLDLSVVIPEKRKARSEPEQEDDRSKMEVLSKHAYPVPVNKPTDEIESNKKKKNVKRNVVEEDKSAKKAPQNAKINNPTNNAPPQKLVKENSKKQIPVTSSFLDEDVEDDENDNDFMGTDRDDFEDDFDLPVSSQQIRTNRLRDILSQRKKAVVPKSNPPPVTSTRKKFKHSTPSTPVTTSDPFSTPKSDKNRTAPRIQKESHNIDANNTNISQNNSDGHNNKPKSILKGNGSKKNKRNITWAQNNQQVVFLKNASPNAPPSSRSSQPHQEVKSPHSHFNKIMQRNLMFLSQMNQGRKKNKHN